MKSKSPALSFLLFFGMSLMQAGVSAQSSDLGSRLQSVLDSIVKVTAVPGATFTAILPGGERISIASGHSDKESLTPMKPGDCMLAGSVGKTFVVATVLKLAEQGKLGLDDSVKKFFTGQDWYKRLPNGGDITVRMLMKHSSGIPEYVYDTAIWSALKANPDKTWTGEERLSYSCKHPPEFGAGKGWSYADANYILLGMIIEKVTGKDFYLLADEFFLRPQRLNHTIPAIKREMPCLVQGYTGLGAELFLPQKMISDGKYAFNPQLEWTGGGFLSNTDDLASWALQLYGRYVLSPLMKHEMIDAAGEKSRMNSSSCYGLGVIVGKTGMYQWYGHTGFAPGYVTVMEYIPGYEISMALQVNTDKLRKEREACFDKLKEVILKSLEK